MSQKNLTYKHNFNYPVNQVYNLIEEEQLKFFQHYDSKIETFVKGIKIKKQMLTKTAKKSVDVTMCVKDVVKNKKIEVVTIYQQGDIVTTYEFKEINDGTQVIYFEDNHFKKGMNELNFNIMSILYRWFYKRNVKKRMQYIEMMLERN
ncbi:DUF3284 domain-containing protein [Thomasclavelia sp.]|uniref:DUF3284 domain-containing protein n=1 Tax=Thomasclavelia sp. TaxID=3025757 RepID=UPI0025EA5241|nr:DUF3284 domain-containing protein [Thomasclavelia sp.]